MTPRPSLVGRITGWPPFERWWVRALVFGPLIALAIALTLFPERHRAVASFTPAERDAMGLNASMGQFASINMFGNQAAIEAAMRVGKSVYVRDRVIDATKLGQRLGEPRRVALQRFLEDRVEVRSLRGGIITVEMLDRDPALARDVVAAYQGAIETQLADIARKQVATKRAILERLVTDSSTRLANAQAAYDAFRLTNRYAEPRAAMVAIGERVPALEVAIKRKEVELAAARRAFTDANPVVKQIVAEIAELRGQLAAARTTAPGSDQSVGRLITNSSQLIRLERELGIAKAFYENYLRFLQTTTVEDMTSGATVRVLENAYVESGRQLWMPALALAIALILLWLAIEFYRLRPPVGARLATRDPA